MSARHAFRYAGSKLKLAARILEAFPAHFWGHPLLSSGLSQTVDYREPFFGSGAIGLRVIEALPELSRVWINDADPGIAHYWRAVLESPEELIRWILDCHPTVDLYRTLRVRADDATVGGVEAAFITVFLHQCSYSGLGKKAGSPIGGWNQTETFPQYRIDCRWHPERLAKDIRQCHKVLDRLLVTITCGDFTPLFEGIRDPAHTFLYCDPPYVKRGPALYNKSMTTADHERLAAALHRTACPWVLSYDDDPLVRRLYGDCRIDAIDARYTVTNGVQRSSTRPVSSQQELLITALPAKSRPKHSLVVTGRTGYHYQHLSEQSGLPATTIRNRIRRGFSLERALTQPLREKADQVSTAPLHIVRGESR